MPTISRAARAELVHQAAEIRARGQFAGHSITAIAAEIAERVPSLNELEIWRLAYGWTRPQVVSAIGDLYTSEGLARPRLSSARLCRWEHNGVRPEPEYLDALAQVYGVTPRQLGFDRSGPCPCRGYGRAAAAPSNHRQGAGMARESENTLRAVADSIQLHRELEGPAGGPGTREQLQQAVAYYSTHYGHWPPATVAAEVHRARQAVVDMLDHEHTEQDRTELRAVAGWLSALLGNASFHTSDPAGAHLHLGTAARLGISVDQHRLTGWSLGAQSMVATFQGRAAEALDLATAAHDYTHTPLHRAQITAWCELRALAELGRTTDARQAAVRAQQAMDVSEDEPDAGRFGMDRAELHQHLAEAALQLGDHRIAAEHARTAQSLKPSGSGGWAAATAIGARALAREHAAVDASSWAHQILDAVPPERLRATTRQRLTALDHDLHTERHPSSHARELRERLAAVPAHVPQPRTSPEPNGH